MESKCNEGICCDVCECVHNENGCDCNLEKVAISQGENQEHHYCKSFKSKHEERGCGKEDCHC